MYIYSTRKTNTVRTVASCYNPPRLHRNHFLPAPIIIGILLGNHKISFGRGKRKHSDAARYTDDKFRIRCHQIHVMHENFDPPTQTLIVLGIGHNR